MFSSVCKKTLIKIGEKSYIRVIFCTKPSVEKKGKHFQFFSDRYIYIYIFIFKNIVHCASFLFLSFFAGGGGGG